MRGNTGSGRWKTLTCVSFSVVGGLVGAQELEKVSFSSPLREACANAFDYHDPRCLGNATLYWGSGNRTDLSCAHCVCGDEGWGGVDCGRCLDVSVCPDKVVDGVTVSATNCSSETLLLTEEEARSFDGKIFSCSCGGGEDLWTDYLCDKQPDTWIQFAVTGGGTDEDPALISVKEYAGIHARSEEHWPGEYKYHFPKIFDGLAGPCKVYRDKCLPVQGTDVGERTCVLFDCDTTEGKCPPEEYPMCEGFPNCLSPSGDKYIVHPCTAVPQSNKAIVIACQEEKINGSFVCYYQQPGVFAPMSMTCDVGSCLYEGGAPVEPSGSMTKRVAWTIGAQMAILLSLAGILLMCFVLFATASDPGTAAAPSTKATATTAPACLAQLVARLYQKKQKLPPARRRDWGANEVSAGALDDGDDLNVPLLDSTNGDEGGADDCAPESGAVVSTALGRGGNSGSSSTTQARQGHGHDTVVSSGEGGRLSSDASVHTVNLDGAEEDVASAQLGYFAKRPAVLRWSTLGYYVRGQDDSEMTVLKGVSGFAGPEPSRGFTALSTGDSTPQGNYYYQSDPASNQNPGNFRENAPGYTVPLSANHDGGSHRISAGFSCVPSTMTGILGASGAGKSSLLDLLAGRKRKGEGRTSGWLSLTAESNSGRGGGGAESVRQIAGYVPQEDVLPGTLTCYEHLMFHARLRMPRDASYAERRARVLWVVEELGLARVADSRIGDDLERGLSGGERRRLSIAAELVARPALLFLDEPTTGLDAATALRVMTLLRRIATRGTTVLCSLHQPRPRVLSLLDKVILLSNGQVAFFGSPAEAAPYFESIGRPFPPDQPHPADAMLTLACRADGVELPSLFRRSPLATAAASAAAAAVSAATVVHLPVRRAFSSAPDVPVGGETVTDDVTFPESGENGFAAGGAGGGGGSQDGNDVETELVEVGHGMENTLGRSRERRPQARRPLKAKGGHRGSSGSGAVVARGGQSTASFLVQVEALSRRLLLRAVRHPLLLVLHFGGSVAMALCLASVFWGRLGFNLEGAQDRFGALFFLLLYLSLLSLTSLPVWREDRRLFLTETMGGAYGHLPYFTSVALADILLVRVLPPLVFAIVAYPLMGLNSAPDNSWCLLWFAAILVLANVTVALGAMGIGALGLPLDLSNLVGGLMVLALTAFGRFLLNGNRIPLAWRWLSNATPLGYAFEALLINEFSDDGGIRPYRIEGSHCSPDLPVIEPLGPEILVTFSFAPDRLTMRLDVAILVCLALGLWVLSLLVFFFATRTKPLLVGAFDSYTQSRYPPSTSNDRRNASLSTPIPNNTSSSRTRTGNNSANHSFKTGGELVFANERVESLNFTGARRRSEGRPSRHVEFCGTSTRNFHEYSEGDSEIPITRGSRANRDRPIPLNAAEGSDQRLPQTHPLTPGGGVASSIQQRASALVGGSRMGGSQPVPLLLSWEGLRYAIPVPKNRLLWWFKSPRQSDKEREIGVEQLEGGTASLNAAGDMSLDARISDNLAVNSPFVTDDILVVLDGISGFAGPKQSSSVGVTTPNACKASTEGTKATMEPAIVPAAEQQQQQPEGEVDPPMTRGDGGGNRSEPSSSTVTAIMGPSGAGKTSLLNALAGRIHQVSRRGKGAGGRRGVHDGAGDRGARTGLTGPVRLNGVEVDAENVRRVSAYVTQEDVLPDTLTCYEHMMFHAHLRLPQGTSFAGRRARVIEVLGELGLLGIRDSRIGGGLMRGISGGEKRRLSIATELLTRPPLLFLDEPTTGLDSSTALLVMKLVSHVAARGTTVLCSLHQPRPEIVSLLDKVILLSRGRVAFSGPPSEAESYFASIGRPLALSGDVGIRWGVNPADAMLDAVGDAETAMDRGAVSRNSRVGDPVAEAVVEEGNGLGVEAGERGLVAISQQLAVAEVRAAEALCADRAVSGGSENGAGLRISPPLSTQLKALLLRSALNVSRDPYLAWLHVVLTLCVGLIVGSLFRDLGRLNEQTAGVQDRLGVMFLLLLYLSLLCLTSLAAWRKQMSLFLHERASGAYGPFAHLTAASAVDALACRIFPPLLLALTVRPMAALREGSWLGLAAGLVAFNLSLASVLAACGAGARSSQEALAMGCLVVLFAALLSGFLVSKDDLPRGWNVLAWVSPFGRGFEALVANEFSPYGAVFRLSTKIGATTAYTDLMTGDAILHCFGFDGGRYFADIAFLAAVGVCGLTLAFLLLKRSR